MRSLEADEKPSPGTPHVNGVGYFVCIDIPAYRLQNFFFGDAEADFSINLKHCNYSSSWNGGAVGRTKIWIFTPLIPSSCINYVALDIL